jgi:hypothetical protein
MIMLYPIKIQELLKNLTDKILNSSFVKVALKITELYR